MRLRRCEDIKHVFGRLLYSLEQSIECTVGEHMRLVNDIYALFQHSRSIHYAVTKIAYVVNTSIGGSIHFDNVCCSAVIYSHTVLALITRISVYRVKAVDHLGKDLCTGSFTRTSRACKKIGVRYRAVKRLISEY